MIRPGVVDVLFEVPIHIVKGLADGSLIRRGGVVQWLAGPRKGQVEAWLRESGGLAQIAGAGGAPVPAVATQLAGLGVGVNVAIGMQALTLGVVAMGFAYVGVRLRAIEHKIDTLLTGVNALREEVGWLDRRQDIAILAKTCAALETATWAERTGRLDALVPVRGQLAEAEAHYALLMQAMLREARAYPHSELYGTYHGAQALAGAARSRIDTLLDGPTGGAKIGSRRECRNFGGVRRLQAANAKFRCEPGAVPSSLRGRKGPCGRSDREHGRDVREARRVSLRA